MEKEKNNNNESLELQKKERDEHLEYWAKEVREYPRELHELERRYFIDILEELISDCGWRMDLKKIQNIGTFPQLVKSLPEMSEKVIALKQVDSLNKINRTLKEIAYALSELNKKS